jgi:hypothetical protein
MICWVWSTPAICGALPGTSTATLGVETVGSLSFSESGGMTGTGPGGNWPVWDAGATADYNGLGFVLYYMAAGTFPGGAGAGRKYQQICEAAGLHTFCPLYGGKATNQAKYDCLPGPDVPHIWGHWAGGDDPWAIPQNIGWDAWVVHGRDADQELMVADRVGQVRLSSASTGSTSWESDQPYHPICMGEKGGRRRRLYTVTTLK